jgi:hypothetical protein
LSWAQDLLEADLREPAEEPADAVRERAREPLAAPTCELVLHVGIE